MFSSTLLSQCDGCQLFRKLRPSVRRAVRPKKLSVGTSLKSPLRQYVCPNSVNNSFDTLTADDAKAFERVAAALIKRAGAGDDDVGIEDLTDAELLELEKEVEVGTELSHEAPDPERATRGQTAGPSTPFSEAAGFIPRKQRKRQIPAEFLPKVALIGRPNVGKSAMFNRLAGSTLAVVYDQPGVTRDRLYTRAFWGDKEFVVIDTGGLMSDATKLPREMQANAFRSISAEGLPAAIERQAAAGVSEADVVVLVADGRDGLQAGDTEILDWLRSRHPTKKIILAVNKCDSPQKADIMACDFWELGLQPLPVSATSGNGTGELMDAVVAALPPPRSMVEEDISEAPLSIAIIGRPNVGKSSLLNAICGEQRSIVCDMSGTTRDAVDTEVTLPDGKKLVLIDTAGIRKRTKVAGSDDGTEQISVERAIRAVRRAEIAVLVIDGIDLITQQDFRLAELIADEGRAVVVVVNKWDRVDKTLWTEEKMEENVGLQLRQINWATTVCATATRGRGVPDVVKAILEAGEQHRRRVPTATLNMVVREAVSWKGPPTVRNTSRKGRIYYATQAGIQPPTFVFFVNDVKLFPDDYRRYLERALRENIGFPGTPLRIFLRGKPARQRPEARPEETSPVPSKRSY